MVSSSSSQRNFRSLLSTFRSPDYKPTKTPDENVGFEETPTKKPYRGDSLIPNFEEFQRQPQIPNAEIDVLDDDIPLDAFDKELLSQLGHDATELTVPMYEPKVIPHNEPFSTPLHRGRSSKFSSSNTLITPPFRPLASSSSGFESPPSPLLTVEGISRGKFHGEDLDVHKSPHWPPAREITPPAKISPFQSRAIVKSPEIQLKHAPPIIQGIRLVSTRELPDRFRTLFSFPLFNAIQSKTFPVIYHRADNVVLSAPTGSGKTVIMELAICKLVSDLKDSRFKVVYLAPTKSLCSERFRDWRAKFAPLDLQCAELTGDTDHFQIRNVQQASIIITTPEKWDSMTRKWKDHMKLMQLIKLVLIDEVHILKEARGATLEAVVSRMKSVNSNVRFVALSATVPNSEDIATWLGKDPTNQHLPAHRERFGEEFRPVRLQKFVYGYQANGNDFAFDKVCETKLPEVLAKHSSKKPILVFCCTRNSAIATSKNLAKLWSSTNPPQRLWKSPTKPIHVQNADLSGIVSTGVAFHHAGLDSSDRHTIETSFLNGQINVICCTSTLAVGVNLPCHLVVIKNTVSWQDGGCKEYADLEMMQMLGRAGRPQFDDSAVGVILTRKERVTHYEKLVSGTEPLESCLHLNLIDHLNAEIGLGTVTDIESAIRWLRGTFFFVRLQRNPTYYKLKEGGNRADEEELLRQICEKDLELLQENDLVTPKPPFKSTELGDAMARYYVKFETMKLFLSLPPKAKMSEILSVIAQADEFRDIRLKPGEKSLYKEINKANGIKFPIKTDINLSAHKITLLIQSELGAVELPSGEQFQKHRLSFQQDKSLVFSHINRIIRCIIDCQLAHGDSVSARHALELSRSLGAKAWDDSVLQLKQIDQIGIVAVRKFASAGITNMEQLEAAEPIRIETVLSRNPPFGMKLLARVAEFPKPRVSLKEVGKDIKPGKTPRVKFRADIGFVNEKPPLYFQKRQVYVCFLAEISDGRIIDFRRFHASKLQKGQQIVLTAEIKNPFQTITCTVMCDEIAGTMRQAEIQPTLPKFLFSSCKGTPEHNLGTRNCLPPKTSMTSNAASPPPPHQADLDEFSDDPLNYSDFILEDFDDIQSRNKGPVTATAVPAALPISSKVKKTISRGNSSVTSEPVQLENGKWACNHRCKDKTACKHLCCREGTDQPPKQSKKQVTEASNKKPQSGNCEAKSNISKDNIKLERQVEVIDLTKPEPNKKKLTTKAGAENSSIKHKGRVQTPTLHHSYSRRATSPLSDDTLDPLQLPLPARKGKVMKYTLSDGDDFEEFESLMGDFESSPTKNNIPIEKSISQTSEHRSPTNNADFEDSGDLFVEDDAMNDDCPNYINDKPIEVIPFKNLDDIPCTYTSQEKDHEETVPAIRQPKAELLPLPAQSLQYNVDVLPTGQSVENGHLFLANPSAPDKNIPDTTVSGKENLDIFKLIPSKRKISDLTATEIPLAEGNIFNIQHQQNSPQPEHLRQIDPLLLEEFGAVAEFY
ncbi:ATP-dependent DNA helicase [Trichophyton interdigitale]|uniref:DNA 3'-5' helicase n=1 Tax=Trichophyton interdigitale TaxID=101480 RepID=A0A9P5CVA8_9EURO|nr:ATP-dependent DNA helicase [Trichophyton interdigitale]KAF3900002.1 ATP-dependent DNA helicase [Trichophyton interdigitale]